MNPNRAHEPQTVLTPTEARQGSRRRMNLRVLVVSLVLLGVIGLALTTAFAPEEASRSERTAGKIQAPPPAGQQTAPQAVPAPTEAPSGQTSAGAPSASQSPTPPAPSEAAPPDGGARP
ncbi:MAG TPA: hypothetical protein PKD49_04400 [Hyphomicrobium sp.]|nr:hypothetical protein [Hyphomicrobium sp.]